MFSSNVLKRSLIIIVCFVLSLYCFKSLAQANSPIMEYDIIIDVGHGGVDGGAVSQQILEKELNLQIGILLYKRLQQKGYAVGITRLSDYALSDDSTNKHLTRHSQDLRQRTLIANELKPKMFISLHANAAKSKKVRGPVIIYKQQAESYLLAELLQQEMNEFMNCHKSSRSGQRYYLLKSIEPSAIIAEVGYISNPEECKRLIDQNYQRELVEHIVNAIDEFFVVYP